MSQTSGLSRRTLLQTIALGALAGCASVPAGPPAPAAGGITSLVAPRIPFRIEQLGRVRDDPCRCMKYIPETGSREMSTLPEMIRIHLESEAVYASAVLAPVFRPDWGDPEAYAYMASISLYENVQARACPPLLCTSGFKDDPVGSWEAAKLVAAVRHTSTGDAPAILRLDADAGHQSGGGLSARYQEMALYRASAGMVVAGGL